MGDGIEQGDGPAWDWRGNDGYNVVVVGRLTENSLSFQLIDFEYQIIEATMPFLSKNRQATNS
ncbi:hypothetical protein V6582_19740 [Agrobacterium vitis]|uniref:hypothetical protein n=1 Tax=Agrobacterium vitis TaxID=373 RepID=UPI0012E90EA5|nr:hypothetical protein [Agrobacterium vitis]MVA26326.1 hypothetical protein [Agrobacterium vitis]